MKRSQVKFAVSWMLLSQLVAPFLGCFGAVEIASSAKPTDRSLTLVNGPFVPRAPKSQPQTAAPVALGVGLGLFATDPDYDYTQMVSEIAQLGATDLLLVVAWYQSSVGSHDIKPREKYSPAEKTIVRTIQTAHDKGLKVTLLPIVRLINRAPHQWRGRIDPVQGAETWFQSYAHFLGAMTQIAASTQIERLSVGSELVSMEAYHEEWRKLIADVRKVYRGRLIYSANWDHYWSVPFWDAVDDLGVTGYFELASSPDHISEGELVRAWQGPMQDLQKFRFVHQKPLMMTEVGYPSKVTAAQFPWDETRQAPTDHGIQARLYAAFCQAFTEGRVLNGFFIWNWFGYGGLKDTTYSPRNKPAANVLRQCFHNPAWNQKRTP